MWVMAQQITSQSNDDATVHTMAATKLSGSVSCLQRLDSALYHKLTSTKHTLDHSLVH